MWFAFISFCLGSEKGSTWLRHQGWSSAMSSTLPPFFGKHLDFCSDTSKTKEAAHHNTMGLS